MRAAVHWEFCVAREPFLPGEGGRGIEQDAEIGRGKRAQLDQHALAGAQPEIGPADRGRVAGKQQTPGRHRARRVAERRQLAFDDRLGARRRGCD